MRTIEIAGQEIVINSNPVQIRSGAMHYFRVHPEYWRDRLLKLKQCGLNTVETYLAWNFHEAKEGVFDFAGWRDFGRFLEIAAELDLMAIVRPGPYICSEWDFGGLPAWLLAKAGMRLRCVNTPYLAAVDRYLAAVLPQLARLQWDNGGPVIMMQVENEYGSICKNHGYLEHLVRRFREHGVTLPLFVSDWANEEILTHGSTPETLLTANCRNHPGRYLDVIQKLRPGVPEIIMELWSGVAHFEGCDYRRHDPDAARQDVEELLKRNANFNFYMFHGGTSFGFMPGAVADHDFYRPYLNSYDTDAPLDEAGNPTPKYFAIQKLIKQYRPEAFTAEPERRPARAFGRIDFIERVSLFDSLEILSKKHESAAPLRMEELGQDYGFILYRTDVSELPEKPYTLTIRHLRDRAQVFVDGLPAGTLGRNDRMQELAVNPGKLDLLVENRGRVNTGMRHDTCLTKGLESVYLDSREIFGWEMHPLPLDDLSGLRFSTAPVQKNTPAFHRGVLKVEVPADTWLRVPYGTKGVVWINGFNLGRYTSLGPQFALYLPAPLLREGENEVILLELHDLREPFAEAIDHPDLGREVTMAL